jgi:hypothetical protein
MMKKLYMLLLFIPAIGFAIDISIGDGARLDIVSRTSFGVDLDNPYRFGLSNELTQLDLVFGLAPYQKLSNKVNSPNAVGFIDITLFHLDLLKTSSIGYNPPSNIGTNRYQTGEFLAGIVKGNWLFQLNALGNEPFTSPWNKGLQFVNDGFKLSWAYLDSMVDIRRVNAISGVPAITRRGEENMAGDGQTQEHDTMKQFGFDSLGNIADRLGQNPVNREMIAVMYNNDNFGVNVKLGTEWDFTSPNITKNNMNGIAAGVDTVFTPAALPKLKIFASLMGTVNYEADNTPDPIFGGTRIGYTIPLNDDISVEPFAGFDLGTRIKDGGGAEKPGYEISGGVTMRWPGQAGWLKDYILNSDGRVFPGMSLGYKIYDELENDTGLEHSIKFTLFEPKGDEGLFYGLGSEIIMDFVDLTGVTEGAAATANDPPGGFRTLVTAYFDYTLPGFLGLPGAVVPWTILYYDNLPGASGSGRINDMKVDLGINLENAISNTTFGIVWNTGSLIQQSQYHWGYIRFIAEIRL